MNISDLPKCEYCKAPFVPNHKKQKFCSDAHRQAAWQAEHKKQKQAAK